MPRSLTRFLAPGAALAAVLAVSACTVGPNYKAPTPPVPSAFAGPQAPTADPQGLDLARWWRGFGDPELTRLIEIGLRQAPDLQTAQSRLRQARFQVIEAHAAELPSVDATGSAVDYKVHKIGDSDVDKLIQQYTGQSGTSSTTSTPSTIPNISMFSAGFDATWEMDIFGGARRQAQAARAQAEAAQWNVRDARVSLCAEIASDYLQMRGYQEQARIQQAEVDRQARSLSILENTAHVGLRPQGDALRQRTQLAQARAQLAPLRAQAAAMMHALAVLAGAEPETLIPELEGYQPLLTMPPMIPAGLPVDLIRRRPDVRAAERSLAAATADIGVAVADLYPKISLSAMPELSTGWIGHFFLGKSAVLSAQGQVDFPLLDFGRRRAVVSERREQREQAYIQWRKTVLTALRDVEDALTNLAAAQAAHAELEGGVADARRSLSTVEAQYRVGLQTYTPVLDSQQSLLQTQNALAQNDVQLRTDMAAYYKALGGGWSQDDAPAERPVIKDMPKHQ